MADEIFRTTVTMDMQGQAASIVQHWKITDPSVTDDWENAKDLLVQMESGIAPLGFINRLVLLLSEDVFVSSVIAQRIHPTGGNSASVVLQRDDEPGGIASPWHAGQLAGVAIWITSDRPDVTGRNFIPGVPESMIEGGRFEAAYVTAMDNFIATVIAGFSVPGGLFVPVVWERDRYTLGHRRRLSFGQTWDAEAARETTIAFGPQQAGDPSASTALGV